MLTILSSRIMTNSFLYPQLAFTLCQHKALRGLFFYFLKLNSVVRNIWKLACIGKNCWLAYFKFFNSVTLTI